MSEFPFDTDQIHAIRLASVIASCFGIVGSVFVISTYMCIKSLQSYHRSLIIYLCVANFGKAVSGVLSGLYPILQPHQKQHLCYVQAGFIQYFDVSASLWAASIATYLYLGVYKMWQEEALKKAIKIFIGLGFGLPLIPVFILFLDGAFGQANPGSEIAWCWIAMDRPVLRLTMYYIPLIIMWIFTIVLYITVMKQVSRLLSFLWKRTAFRLSLFLLVSIVSNMPALINRFQNLFAPSSPIYLLYILQVTFLPLEGFFDAIVYPSRNFFQALKNEARCCGSHTFSEEEYAAFKNEHEPILITNGA
jgi:hypothetical protein